MKRFFIFFFIVLLSAPVLADLKVYITQGSYRSLPIALPDFYSGENKESAAAQEITNIIRANLSRTGLFSLIDDEDFIQDTQTDELEPEFADWRVINAEALVHGNIQSNDKKQIKTEFRLWDVLAEKQIAGLALTTPKENQRRVAHMISDVIYNRMTGEKGYFDSRIVYVAETGPPNRRKKRLAIMDQDGANHRFLTSGDYIVMTPRFSPKVQKIAYMAYFNETPRVYILDLETGQQKLLGHFKGMTFAPRFSPVGNTIIFSMAKNGNSDIYTMNLDTKKIKRLTKDSSIDTSPSFSPDGKKVVFNSDRHGSQQLYVMDNDGKNVKRISFGERGRYATPVWSPRGDWIAFTKMLSGTFYIGVMRPDGSGERLLSESYLDEGPTWSPNGRVLLFFREYPPGESVNGKQSAIFSIDLTGDNLREIITPTDASDPAWSPLIP